ncbi:MAG TPA: sigma-70 family RNA polymerase sigma factor [Dyella sp.]|nr:sigma-70 family RNA polymerase sigma factor [Dyella sp.]
MSKAIHQRSFEALLHDHRGIILKVAAVYARDPDDRLDLAQEIRVQLWRSFGAYDASRAKVSTWMYRIALNVAISYRRRDRALLTGRVEPLEARHLETIGGGDSVVEDDERLAALYAFIGELDPLNRALILLYLEDRPYGEIAEVLGITETNVATRLGRIRQTLRGRVTAAETSGA